MKKRRPKKDSKRPKKSALERAQEGLASFGAQYHRPRALWLAGRRIIKRAYSRQGYVVILRHGVAYGRELYYEVAYTERNRRRALVVKQTKSREVADSYFEDFLADINLWRHSHDATRGARNASSQRWRDRKSVV